MLALILWYAFGWRTGLAELFVEVGLAATVIGGGGGGGRLMRTLRSLLQEQLRRSAPRPAEARR